MTLTTPGEADRAALARLWHDAWHDAHAAHVPASFLAKRTLASFERRLRPALPQSRMAVDADGPLGFCQVTCDGPGELDQLFLAPRARGTGLAGRLLADGEARLAQAGCRRPFLYCLPENARARAFYTRQGWNEIELRTVPLKTEAGTFDLPCLVFEKDLIQPV